MTDLVLRDVVAALESLYPQDSAADWDRVGLVTGDAAQPVRRVLFALDPTLAVIDEALTWKADLLVTHHPLLLRGVHSVDTSTAKGAAVTQLIRGALALYVAHTNADVAEPGVSSVLADALGLTGQRALSTHVGVDGQQYAAGRVGELGAPESLADFATRVVTALPRTAGGI
ncbi:MAG: Nif3-like dinuclear metal center hexameric protein, partial [Actinomycetota bacterium]|nr:Nif3-like dinuclear metal center hexameric protein [Actinomycetota bacterium]